ncbi:MAG: hypothetical protein IKY13_05680, partial [Bacteroidaceae bacterium]|nr:hypothetical protein [Bacteroidaceae bacterium]
HTARTICPSDSHQHSTDNKSISQSIVDNKINPFPTPFIYTLYYIQNHKKHLKTIKKITQKYKLLII